MYKNLKYRPFYRRKWRLAPENLESTSQNFQVLKRNHIHHSLDNSRTSGSKNIDRTISEARVIEGPIKRKKGIDKGKRRGWGVADYSVEYSLYNRAKINGE